MSLEEGVPESGFLDSVSVQGSPPRVPLAVSVSWIESTTLMAIAGEVDAYSVGRLVRKLAEITPGLRGDLIIDVGMVSFMNSAGLAFLIAAHEQLKAQGAHLVVFSPTPRVLRLLQITGLTQVLTIEAP
jgi:anti-sigma B factor antagonist